MLGIFWRLETLQRAGVALLGGHTVQDQEIKFGYAVTGEIDPRRIWTNAGARAGDVLFLTKPLGTGIIATALKAGGRPRRRRRGAVDVTPESRGERSVAALPPARARLHRRHRVRPDRARVEMAVASGVTLEIDAARVPLLPGALDLASANIPGGGRTNAEHFGPDVGVSSAWRGPGSR